MLQCPNCQRGVTHKVLDEWFKCPGCRKQIRLRVNQNGYIWVETHWFENPDIRSIKIDRELVFPPAEDRPAISQVTFPNLENKELKNIKPPELHFKGEIKEGKWVLTEEKPENSQAINSSDVKGWAFGCGTILAGVGIYAFSRLVGFQLDLGGYVTLVLVALVCGFIASLIAK